ncbi:hypothetical protein QTP70_032255 [Hemibagrus guttatus]|uniref:Ig-like domain-containing protein n=1 Tax=Hemibagrus guttatus TaxID=175788 RepID=A0AAE0Q0J7_9TELE|nr:hypothetical protein QTP70_032255 [Hemibagrus guttatus]
MLNDGVHEKGSEGNSAVISCSYAEPYKTSPKYFCKEIHKNCETLLKTDGQNDWKLEERLSLHDSKEKNMFVVTINNLRVEDAGRYGCGVETTGQHRLTVVHLTVTKATTWPNSAENMKDACIYDEIQHSNPAEEGASETSDVMFSPNSYPECKSIYAKLTKPKQEQAFFIFSSNIMNILSVSGILFGYESVNLGLYLGAVMLLCGITGAIFVIIKFNKAKAAATQPGNYTEPDVVCGQGHSECCVDDKIFPKSTSVAPIQSPDSITYAIPTPSRNRTRSLPSHCKPAAIQGCSGETRIQHSEAVMYSVIPQSGTCPRPQSSAPYTSTRPVSLQVPNLEQRSHVFHDTPAISEASHDVYATVKRQ